MDEDKLRALFAQLGTVSWVVQPKHDVSGAPKGTARLERQWTWV